MLKISGKFANDVGSGYFETYLNAFKGRKGKCLVWQFSLLEHSDWMTHASQLLGNNIIASSSCERQEVVCWRPHKI